MRRPTLLALALVILLIPCARAGAQTVVPGQDDQQAAQAAAQRKVEIEKVVSSVRQSLDKFSIELKAATSGMLGPVVTGAPYSAVTTNESIQALADGNRIVQRSTYNVARDAQGRVRREELAETGAVLSVMIMDPVANVSYVLDPENRTARKVALLRQNFLVRSDGAKTDWSRPPVEGAVIATTSPKSAASPAGELKPKIAAAGTFVYGGRGSAVVTATTMDYRRESLGTQMMEGVTAEGTRTVSTIPAGQIGNERPIDVVSEEWNSKDLQMTIMSRHSDPRTGETTYRVANIRRGEPDPSLFQVPADYTVKATTETTPTWVVK
jgi:hypothetical protein